MRVNAALTAMAMIGTIALAQGQPPGGGRRAGGFVPGQQRAPGDPVQIARGKTLYTPPPTIGILPGTTQAAVFRGAERVGWTTKIEPLRVEDLRSADGVFLSSSVRKLTRVHTLDGERLPDSTEIHRELADAYEAVYA